MRLYRFCRKHHADDLSGIGARLVGGRWSSPGVTMLYTPENSSLGPGLVLRTDTVGRPWVLSWRNRFVSPACRF